MIFTEQQKLDRINELAKKQKAEGLSENEKSEQALLRKEYVEAYKRSLVAQLESTYYIDETGHKRKVTKKDDGKQ